MPGTGFPGANPQIEYQKAASPISKCQELSIRASEKVSNLVWDLVMNWPNLLNDLYEIVDIVKESFWACLFKI